jgi:predicted RNase H-like nuclease (RuvC/YqgF family)
MGNEMPKQRTALDMIKQQEGHGGMSPEALLLHEKQAEDAERMELRMCEIEKKVDNLDRKFDDLDKKMDELKHILERKSSFCSSLKEVLSNKVFIYILVSLMCVLFGVNVGEVGTFIFK